MSERQTQNELDESNSSHAQEVLRLAYDEIGGFADVPKSAIILLANMLRAKYAATRWTTDKPFRDSHSQIDSNMVGWDYIKHLEATIVQKDKEIASLKAQLEEAQNQVKSLRAGMQRYGGHDRRCESQSERGGKCTCGYSQTLAAAPTYKKED